jgi:hypothetical protein
MMSRHVETRREFMKRARMPLLLLLLCVLTVPLLSQTAQETASISKEVVGKWISADGKSYIEFRPDGSCSDGELWADGKWHVDSSTLFVRESGGEFFCGSGSLTLIGPNTVTRDYGMGGDPEKFYRGADNRPKPAGVLTVAVAQKVLNHLINQTTVNNTLLTCHACYDPDDKEDNDRAVVVSTYSPPLNQFLIDHGYIRVDGGQEVFTSKAKRSKFYGFNDRVPGLRLASFRNPRLLTSSIADPKHVPIEYDLVPTEITMSFFGGVKSVKSSASFSYEDEAWSLCIACNR